MVRRPPKARRSQQDALRGCLLNQLLLKQSQSPKKPPLRSQPRGRRAATLLKTEMPRQTRSEKRHKRLTPLAMLNEKITGV
ncbi:putative Dresden prostate carcinoma protein 2 isoform X1 [Carassius auratus]|uniref:Dresden prostate carcinoma protein 2 isoform X1 n=1 Tax=Carassius auratus TaxID=7957 RepID=A0A6P6NMR7_CARAU|nr:putative Dresden prostate carcinoma protein 2 isoform X1 [Carassius auratus]